MQEQSFFSQNDRSNALPKSVSEGNPFVFQKMTLATPIRFNPDTPDQNTTTSLSSHSTLSSSMTPERITLNVKHVVGKSPSLPTSGSVNVLDVKPTPVQAAVLKSATNAPTQPPSESLKEPNSLIEVSQTKFVGAGLVQASSSGKKLPGKLTTQYFMPDGSVITGKGLGRGRPGVKRGPRKSKAPGEESVGSTPEASAQTPQPSVPPAGAKRKRADSEASNIRARSVSSSLHSRESSIEYNPTATQTRSGRQTQKPVPIFTQTATPSVTASPASKKVLTPVAPTPTLKTHPKIKRKIYRGKEQFALCEHCSRGFGPPGNVIVFCDACNKCWHQRCHAPQIPKEIVADTKAEWFCMTCDKILHGNKKSKKPLPKPEAPPAPPPEQKFGPPFVGAIALTIEQRKKYLETLTREQLMRLLLRAGELAPQMPIFETPIPLPRTGSYLQPQFTSDYVTPVSETMGFNKAGSNDVVPDEGYDDSYDEHAALYPKVGEGVQLPPEREDLNRLLEGPESRTFSHWVKGLPVKTTVDTVPLHQSQFQYNKPGL